jgi:hypothetical protein
VTEEAIVPRLDGWLAGLFDPEHLDETCAQLLLLVVVFLPFPTRLVAESLEGGTVTSYTAAFRESPRG